MTVKRKPRQPIVLQPTPFGYEAQVVEYFAGYGNQARIEPVEVIETSDGRTAYVVGEKKISRRNWRPSKRQSSAGIVDTPGIGLIDMRKFDLAAAVEGSFAELTKKPAKRRART